jgi:prepilin-type N-terminal cleavage/methylation domain-containing protein
MKRTKSAFTLIELLVVIAIIAILAAILFPVFAQAREKSRMISCLSNMRQLGLSLRMYSQDYDETLPSIRFIGLDTTNPNANVITWRNVVIPYIKNIGIFRCPSNPASRLNDGDGWQTVPGRQMPRGYGMNATDTTWVPNDWDDGSGWVNYSPLSDARITRPADYILVGENLSADADVNVEWNWNVCDRSYQHMGNSINGPSGISNWIFADGHAKAMKWKQTVLPLNQNKWQIDPNPDPNNTFLKYGWTNDGTTYPGDVCPKFR